MSGRRDRDGVDLAAARLEGRPPMAVLDVGLALLVVITWGVAFVMTRVALDSFSAPELTTLRFLLAAIPALFLPRPTVSWPRLLAVGSTLFAGQFLLQFFAIAHGMPPGLAAVVVQTQALFTILFAALALGQAPSRRQTAGSLLALGGLLLIARTLGHDLTVAGLLLTLGSAVSWGIGNVLLKALHDVEMLNLVVWASLVPPLPALAFSLLIGDSPLSAPGRVSRAAVLATLYLGLVSTVGAYAAWGALLRRYPAAVVAPFALLVPFVAAYGSALVFGERFGPARLAGMGLVLVGLAVIVLPRSQSFRGTFSSSRPGRP